MRRRCVVMFCSTLLAVALLIATGCTSANLKSGSISCTEDSECGGGPCVKDRCLTLSQCGSKSECPNGTCAHGYCWTEACTGDSDCSYGVCLDGYCIRPLIDNQNDLSTEDQQTPLPDSSIEDLTPKQDIPPQPIVCHNGLGETKIGACPNDMFCAKDATCRRAELLAGELCTDAAYKGEDANKACVSGFCRPAPFGVDSYCVENADQCGRETTPAETGSVSCSTDKTLVSSCDVDGKWSIATECKPVGCNGDKGKQPRQCGEKGCEPFGSCVDCFPGVFDQQTGDCTIACSNNSTCQDGAKCKSLQCTAFTTKQVDCDADNSNPANSKDVVEQVTVSYNPTNGWTAPTKCSWVCDTDFTLDNGACIDQRMVPCDQSGVKPATASWTVVNVSISYTTNGGWTTPSSCNWTCNSDWCKQGSQCLQSKSVACSTSGNKPSQSSWTPGTVQVTCQANGTFTSPGSCAWSCNNAWCKEGNQCLQSKSVACSTSGNKPSQSSWTPGNVQVSCQLNGLFSSPSACSWACNNGWCQEGNNQCLQSKSVPCSTSGNKPTQADWNSGNVIVTCQGTNFSSPAACSWTCKNGYFLNKAGNDCVRPIYLVSAGGNQGGPGGNRSTMNSRCVTAVNNNFGSLNTTKSVGFISISASDEIRDLPNTQNVPTGRPILGPTGARLADNWADLIAGPLKITLQSAGITTNNWFSGSTTSGSVSSATCSQWTTDNVNDGAYASSTITTNWLYTHTSGRCGGTYHFLCLTWVP